MEVKLAEKFDKRKKYEILREKLLAYIKERHLGRNDQLPTVREIMNNMGFSYTTVVRTLNDMEKDGIIKKQQGKGIFINNLTPPSKQELAQIALIIPKNYSDYKIFMGILSGVQSELENRGYNLLISISNMNHEKEREAVYNLLENHVSGLIIFLEDNYQNNYSHIEELILRKVPFVLVDRYIPQLETDYVVVDNEKGMYKVCSYLKYSQWCKNIIFIYPNESFLKISSTMEKISGYRYATEVLYGHHFARIYSIDEFKTNMAEIAQSGEKIGVCFNHDEMIEDLEEELKREGKSLPKNFVIFGYANSLNQPKYPTVEQFNEKVGEEAVKILLAKIENPGAPVVQKRIEPKLILPDRKGNYHLEDYFLND